MILITRTPLATALTERLEKLRAQVETLEQANRVVVAKTLWKSSTVRRNVHRPLFDHLLVMAPGLGQCMYCGESVGTAIDHFEPVARNPLRTFDWFNHLLACTICNSNLKRDQFPVGPDGEPLLINPTAEDPLDHLLLSISTGVYTALTSKGEASIRVFGLNLGQRPRGRQAAAFVVELALRRWREADATGNDVEKEACIRSIRDQPFADVSQSMLRQASSANASLLFSPEILSALRHDAVRHALA